MHARWAEWEGGVETSGAAHRRRRPPQPRVVTSSQSQGWWGRSSCCRQGNGRWQRGRWGPTRTNTEEIVRVEVPRGCEEQFDNSSFFPVKQQRRQVCDWLAVICVSMCVSASARFRRGAMWVAGRDTFSSSLPLQFRYEVTEALSVTLGTVSQMCPRPQRRRGRRKAQKDVRDWERAKPGVPQWLPSYTRVKKACDTKDKHTSVCLSLEKSDAP